MAPPTRRRFLATSAAAIAGIAASGCGSSPLRLRPDPKPPIQGKLRLGVIGVGGRGAANLAGVAGENIVALCDVDDGRLQAAAAQHTGAATFQRYQEMFAAVELDAVVVSTPDHTHAPATMAALERQLDVYCEKPLTHTVAEARAVAREAAYQRTVTQMGIQIHSSGNYRRVVEAIRSGVIGDLHEVHCWVGKAWGGGERPTDTPPIPDGLDWEQWLGSVPARPYHPAYHPAGWRRYWDFGTGTLGDMGCHHLDLAFWAADLRGATEVAAVGPPIHAETAPTSMRARWEFPARPGVGADGVVREVPATTLWWHDGGLRPPQFETGELPAWGDGTLFVGERGMLLADYGRHVLLPEARFSDFTPPERSIANSPGHHKEWLDACRERRATSCNFDYASQLTEAVLLGVVAYRLGRGFRWDAAAMRAPDCPEADRLLRTGRV